jgi:hypothetical protein
MIKRRTFQTIKHPTKPPIKNEAIDKRIHHTILNILGKTIGFKLFYVIEHGFMATIGGNGYRLWLSCNHAL